MTLGYVRERGEMATEGDGEERARGGRRRGDAEGSKRREKGEGGANRGGRETGGRGTRRAVRGRCLFSHRRGQRGTASRTFAAQRRGDSRNVEAQGSGAGHSNRVCRVLRSRVAAGQVVRRARGDASEGQRQSCVASGIGSTTAGSARVKRRHSSRVCRGLRNCVAAGQVVRRASGDGLCKVPVFGWRSGAAGGGTTGFFGNR